MKTRIKLLAMVFVIGMSACKKKDDLVENVNPAANTYSSLSDFYKRNGASKQTYMVNATTGGFLQVPKELKSLSLPMRFLHNRDQQLQEWLL